MPALVFALRFRPLPIAQLPVIRPLYRHRGCVGMLNRHVAQGPELGSRVSKIARGEKGGRFSRDNGNVELLERE